MNIPRVGNATSALNRLQQEELASRRQARTILNPTEVAGRLSPARLLSTTLGPGPQRAAWDGRTSSGDTAPAGVYLCELHTEAGRVARRFVVLP